MWLAPRRVSRLTCRLPAPCGQIDWTGPGHTTPHLGYGRRGAWSRVAMLEIVRVRSIGPVGVCLRCLARVGARRDLHLDQAVVAAVDLVATVLGRRAGAAAERAVAIAVPTDGPVRSASRGIGRVSRSLA